MCENRRLFSKGVQAGSRTYFFTVKEARNKARYLLISEVRQEQREEASEAPPCIMIFEEHLSLFVETLAQAIRAIRLEDQAVQPKSRITDVEDRRVSQKRQPGKQEQQSDFPELDEALKQLTHLLGRKTGSQPEALATDQSSKKAYSADEIRRFYPKAYLPWTEDEDRRLAEAYQQGKKIGDLVDMFQRQPSAIRSRLRKLGLVKD